MIRFDSDYTEGCIPEILTALTNTNDGTKQLVMAKIAIVKMPQILSNIQSNATMRISTSWLVAHKPISLSLQLSKTPPRRNLMQEVDILTLMKQVHLNP